MIIALVLAGELIATQPGIYVYDADADWQDGLVGYEVRSSVNSVYDAVLLDNGDRVPVSELFIYVDEHYHESYGEIAHLPGMVHTDIRFYAEQAARALAVRGFTAVRTGGTAELAEVLADTGSATGTGVLNLSYALPSEVYTGDPGDPVLEWVHAGGTLYWTGYEVGGWYRDGGSLHRAENGQELFLGSACVNTGGVSAATGMIPAGGLTEALHLYNADVLFGLDVSGLDDCLALGFTEAGYASIALVGAGDGAVAVIAGTPDFRRTDDLAQVIAGGLTPSTVLIDTEHVDFRGTATGSFDIRDASAPLLYIYVGGYYLTYGEAFRG